MAALSAMVSLEIPQVNIMTKMDLLSPKAKKEIEKYGQSTSASFQKKIKTPQNWLFTTILNTVRKQNQANVEINLEK